MVSRLKSFGLTRKKLGIQRQDRVLIRRPRNHSTDRKSGRTVFGWPSKQMGLLYPWYVLAYIRSDLAHSYLICLHSLIANKGQHTFAPTTKAPPIGPDPQPSSSITGNGNSCPVQMVKITLNGRAVWTNDPAFDSLAVCKDYCKPLYDPNKISSSTCIKIGDDYYDDKGLQLSGK